MIRPLVKDARPGLLTLACAYFALGTGSLAVVGLLEPMAASFRTSAAAVAQLVSVFALTFAIAAPTFQVAFSTWSRRRLLLLGLAVFAAGAVGAGLATTLGWAILTRVVMALGAAAVGPMASALAASMVPVELQARSLSLVFGGLIFSTVLGVPLATWAGHALSWRGVFLALAALAVACIPATLRFVRDLGPGARIDVGALFGLFRERSTAWALAATLVQTTSQFTSYALVAVLLASRYGVAPSSISIALLLFGVGGVFGNWLGGRLGDLVAPIRLVWVSVAGMAVAFVALSLVPRDPVAGMALFVAWAVLSMLFQAPQQKRLLALAPRVKGLVLAMNSSAIYLGMSIGSVFGSFAFSAWGVDSLPWASAALMVLAAMTLWRSQRRVAAEAA